MRRDENQFLIENATVLQKKLLTVLQKNIICNQFLDTKVVILKFAAKSFKKYSVIEFTKLKTLLSDK